MAGSAENKSSCFSHFLSRISVIPCECVNVNTLCVVYVCVRVCVHVHFCKCLFARSTTPSGSSTVALYLAQINLVKMSLQAVV